MKSEIIKLIKWAKEKNIQIVIDESFIDFSNIEENPSIINDQTLMEYSNLVVIKSISKSYGIPGLRLGILASSNEELIKFIKKDVFIC